MEYERDDNTMLKGVVKWFNPQKGYGFIIFGGGQQAFVHHTGIKMKGYRTLEDGELVWFELASGPKGIWAKNVVRQNGS